MSRYQKIRLIIFGLLLVFYVYAAVAYTCELCETQYHFKLLDLLESGSFIVDGSDLTLFANMAVLFANGAMSFVVIVLAVIYTAVMAVLSLVSILVFRFIALRDSHPASGAEYGYSLRMFIAAVILSIVLGLVLTLLLGTLSAILFTLIWAFPAWLFYLRPLYERSGSGYPRSL